MEVQAPQYAVWPTSLPSVFVGGTIDNGKARNWQRDLVSSLRDRCPSVVCLNPRRDEWDGGDGARQVAWEMYMQRRSDYKVYWFEPKYLSPVTLAGVAMFGDKRTVVGCSADYAYRENLLKFQEVRGFKMVETWDEFVEAAAAMLSDPETGPETGPDTGPAEGGGDLDGDGDTNSDPGTNEDDEADEDADADAESWWACAVQ